MLSFALLALPLLAEAATYSIKTSYSGADFFSGFNFYEGIDVNNTGNVHYINGQDALTQKLAYVNSAGNAIIKVDNTTVGNPADTQFGRNSVMVTSAAQVTQGDLILFDALHLPFGCSVWGAFWTVGEGTWPDHGEIDIIEGVNVQPSNQYSLHTLQGCQHPAVATGETGAVVTPDCFNQTNGNSGCIVKENTPNNFGAGFAGNGGGAYATLWNADGIKMWFFPRASIPSDFTGNSPNPANWGEPSAIYPTSTCDTSKFFGPQTIILDITICGNYAGRPEVFSPSCGSGLCVDLLKTPSNYDNAYYEIKSLRVFTESGGSSSTSGLASASKTASGSASESKTSTTSTSSPNSAPFSVSQTSWIFIVGVSCASTLVALMASAYGLLA